MEEPLVTVIVPAYNHERYVEDCLKSIIGQTYENLEIIVFNDGSKDSTDKIIRNFIRGQKRKIQYISKDNEGLCKTLNKGLKLSKGKYIAIIASDDMWIPNKIEEQVKFMEKNINVGLIFSDAYFFKTDTETKLMKYSDYKPRLRKYFKNYIQNANLYEELLIENLVIALTVMTRKECFEKVGEFDESLEYEDYDMWLRISKYYPISYLDKPLGYYRVHDLNMSNNTSLMLKGALKTIMKQYKDESLNVKRSKIIILFLLFLFRILKNRINKKVRFKK